MFKQILTLLTRWVANSLGLWLAVYWGLIAINGGSKSFIIGGLLLAILNALLKPLLIILTLPLIAVTLGFFLIVINAAVIYVLSLFYSSLILDSFLYTMLAGIVVGLVNYIVTIIFERVFK
jgi:putative membrane protein